MDIFLFNTANNGDTFLVQEMVKQLCKENPSIKFYYLAYSNFFFYQQIPNLICIGNDAQYTKTIESNDYVRTYQNNEQIKHMLDICQRFRDQPFKMLNENQLAINTWISGATTAYGKIIDLECNLITLQNTFIHILESVKHIQRLKYTPLSPLQLIPSFPTPIPYSFIEWKNNHSDKELIFYYNYQGFSGSCVVLNEFQHNLIIFNLAILLPTKYILVPRISDNLQKLLTSHSINNVVDCRKEFGIIETPDCKNLVDISVIAGQCSTSIHFDVGANFYYFNTNQLFDKDNNKHTILQIGRNPYYYNHFLKIIQSVKLLNNIEPSIKYEFLNATSAFETLQTLLKYFNLD
jgi:hypothetical protein